MGRPCASQRRWELGAPPCPLAHSSPTLIVSSAHTSTSYRTRRLAFSWGMSCPKLDRVQVWPWPPWSPGRKKPLSVWAPGCRKGEGRGPRDRCSTPQGAQGDGEGKWGTGPRQSPGAPGSPQSAGALIRKESSSLPDPRRSVPMQRRIWFPHSLWAGLAGGGSTDMLFAFSFLLHHCSEPRISWVLSFPFKTHKGGA